MKETNHDKDCRKSTRLIKNNSESENKLAGHSHEKINSKENTKNELIEKILHRNNLNEAFKQVKSNKGSAGIDGITTEELLEHLKENKDKILGQIRARKYKPKPVKRVQIPKANDKKRNLGIPTTTDRVIQQAIAQILSPIYEKKFSENSYGFRPNRSAHDALKRIILRHSKPIQTHTNPIRRNKRWRCNILNTQISKIRNNDRWNKSKIRQRSTTRWTPKSITSKHLPK